MRNHPSKYLNSDMSLLFKPGSPAEIISKQMDFLFTEGTKLAKGTTHSNRDTMKKYEVHYLRPITGRGDVEYEKEISEMLDARDAIDFINACEEERDEEDVERERLEVQAELAWDAHKEECSEVDHEKCF